MGPIEAFIHVANLFVPALSLGAISAGLTKLMWRRDLADVPWWRLAAWAAAGAALATLGGLAVFGRDGAMATYAAMVLASAGALWVTGFGGLRR